MIERSRYVISPMSGRTPASSAAHRSVPAKSNKRDLSMKRLIAGAALATLIASPAFAQYRAYGAVTPFGSPTFVQVVAKARAAAIRQCSAVAARYPEYLWGDEEIQQYRACMAVHAQVE
jgi:hypothetical protein